MADFPGNAFRFLSPDDAGTPDGRAVSNALCALAFEQRTANLIAALGTRDRSGQPLISATEDRRSAVHDVLARLGYDPCDQEADHA